MLRVYACVFCDFSFVCLHVCAYAFKSKVQCGSAFEPGACGLPHYCTSTFFLFFLYFRSCCVATKPKKKMSRSHYCTTNAKEIKRMHNVQWLCLKVEYSTPKKARQKDHSYSFSTCREGFSGVAPLTPPPNQIYSRIWYAFSLFLRKFHSVNPFNGNFCEPGRAQFAEKKMEIPSHDVSNACSVLFSAKFEPILNPFRGHARWMCGMNYLMILMTWLV